MLFQLQFSVTNDEKVTVCRNEKRNHKATKGGEFYHHWGRSRKGGYQEFYSKQSLFACFSMALGGIVLRKTPGESNNTALNGEQFRLLLASQYRALS